jgi:hypothetical protein
VFGKKWQAIRRFDGREVGVSSIGGYIRAIGKRWRGNVKNVLAGVVSIVGLLMGR